jgi:hypothetical protein
MIIDNEYTIDATSTADSYVVTTCRENDSLHIVDSCETISSLTVSGSSPYCSPSRDCITGTNPEYCDLPREQVKKPKKKNNPIPPWVRMSSRGRR